MSGAFADEDLLALCCETRRVAEMMDDAAIAARLRQIACDIAVIAHGLPVHGGPAGPRS